MEPRSVALATTERQASSSPGRGPCPAHQPFAISRSDFLPSYSVRSKRSPVAATRPSAGSFGKPSLNMSRALSAVLKGGHHERPQAAPPFTTSAASPEGGRRAYEGLRVFRTVSSVSCAATTYSLSSAMRARRRVVRDVFAQQLLRRSLNLTQSPSPPAPTVQHHNDPLPLRHDHLIDLDRRLDTPNPTPLVRTSRLLGRSRLDHLNGAPMRFITCVLNQRVCSVRGNSSRHTFVNSDSMCGQSDQPYCLAKIARCRVRLRHVSRWLRRGTDTATEARHRIPIFTAQYAERTQDKRGAPPLTH